MGRQIAVFAASEQSNQQQEVTVMGDLPSGVKMSALLR
jgi:hypothetical protein